MTKRSRSDTNWSAPDLTVLRISWYRGDTPASIGVRVGNRRPRAVLYMARKIGLPKRRERRDVALAA